MSQNIKNDIALLAKMGDPELIEEYIKSRTLPQRQQAKIRRDTTQQLSGKDFLQHMRDVLTAMFADGAEPNEIIKSAIGFALTNYHNGVEVGRGERPAGRKNKSSWFGRSGSKKSWFGQKRHYKRFY